jgi:hypothetical protein
MGIKRTMANKNNRSDENTPTEVQNLVFMEFIQLHERQWGTEQYEGRPSLAELLNAPIVAVWSGKAPVATTTGYVSPASAKRQTLAVNDNKFLVTCHHDVDELEKVLADIVLLKRVSPFSYRKLARIYVRQQEMEVTGIKLTVRAKA